MTERPAHFRATDDGFVPTPFAFSHWGEDHLGGPSIVGLAAFALERDYPAAEFMPARLTVDLFRAARGVPAVVGTRLVRDGRRVRNAECDVVQDGIVVARAVMVCYRRSHPPPGEQWTAARQLAAPADLDPAEEWATPYFGTDDRGWSRHIADHQNASRTRCLDRPIDVVAGLPNTAFMRAAMIAELTSLVTNLGSGGIGYINGDLTVALARLPYDGWLGVQADAHQASDGVAVGSATLFDSAGPFGTGLVTSLANPAAQIDFTATRFSGMRTGRR
jgi:acyl-CoA thioesterase